MSLTKFSRGFVALMKHDVVFSVAAILALLSMLLVPPSWNYLGYIDPSVLGILFCLMCVVAGFRSCGLLGLLSQRLLTSVHTVRGVSMVLVALCFFSSMLLTNDVALLAFVPLSLVSLRTLSPLRLGYIIALETLAANLGSMLTPIGNPQNLYLYSYYHMNLADFLATVAPLCMVSFLLLMGLALVGKGERIPQLAPQVLSFDSKKFVFYLLLFFLCLLVVLRVLDYRLCTLITLVALLLWDRTILQRVDYLLLGTFVAFFVLVGNLGSLEVVREAIMQFMQGRELLTAVLVSQVISNVPTAIMLSHFTDHAAALLIGSNLGGLGTLVASLASLISYKLYAKSPNAKPLPYLGMFTLLNAGMLSVFGLLSVVH